MPLKIIFQYTIDNMTLPLVGRDLIDLVPNLRFEQDIAKRCLCTGDFASEAV